MTEKEILSKSLLMKYKQKNIDIIVNVFLGPLKHGSPKPT